MDHGTHTEVVNGDVCPGDKLIIGEGGVSGKVKP
jgi:hypothetical protein